MINIFRKTKCKISYALESIKNRYPCRLIKVKNINNSEKDILIMYSAVTRFNLREATVEEILNDPMIIEKFHPAHAVKIGFLSAAQILLKNKNKSAEIKEYFQEIIEKMFEGMEI